MHRHLDTLLTAEKVGISFPPYQPTYSFLGEYIDEFHSMIGSSATGSGLINLDHAFGFSLKGWLRRADALKLYELAYFAEGDILELGSYHGLSTCILAKAVHNARRGTRILSVDLSAANSTKTTESLQPLGLESLVTTVCSEATAAVKNLAEKRRRFAFVFIDHSHSYRPVYQVCRHLPTVLDSCAFCLFHDFNDRRNGDPAYPQYGVYQAVLDGLDQELFDFYGVYGCTALYRARS